MRYRVIHSREIEALYEEFCRADRLTGRDADALDKDLRSHPHRAGVQLESGYWAARRGRLAILYEILEPDLLVRILVAKLGPNHYSLSRTATYIDQLDSLFKSVTQGTILPEAEELEGFDPSRSTRTRHSSPGRFFRGQSRSGDSRILHLRTPAGDRDHGDSLRWVT